jgi:hypothetical protein
MIRLLALRCPSATWRAAVLAALLWLLPHTAWATWSVIAVDKSTGRVVIA